MKNNKGIILSTYIYILLVFFILILSTMLMVLNNTKVLSNKLKNSANTFSSKKYSFSIVLVGGDVYVAKGTAYVDKGYVAQTIGGESLTAVITSTVNMSTVGTYTYKYEVTYGAYKKSVTRTVYVIESVYYYGYTGSAQTFTVPATGYYNIELWGAQGGSNSGAEGITAGNVGGLGGYTKGIMYLEMGSTYYIFVGGKGAYATSAGLTSAKGYNGGGMAGYDSGCGTSCMKGAGAGGGATDFRLVNGTWNDSVSLNSRIMVAGGGGGAMNWNSPKAGGDGGGLFGNPGMEYNGATNPYTNAQGGTQIAGGAAGVGSVTSSPGIFGIGGDSQITYGGGGGGGYYGGGGGSVNNSVVGSGAGGSSYISGYAGVSSITSAYSTAASYTNKHYSGKYFINGQMIPAVNGDNGKAKITYFDTNMPARVGLNNVRYVKDCINGSNANASNHWVELQAIYNGDNVALNKTVTGTVAQNVSPYLYSRIVDGDITSANYAESSVSGLQCITVDLGKTYNLDEVAVWHYWADARVYNSNKTYVSSNNIDWTTAIDTGNEVETSQGKRVNAYKKNYFYSGSEQTYTAPKNGYYNVELWGARGGSTLGVNGYGGYTKGLIYLNKDETIKLFIGSKGAANGGTTSNILINGGYNGGANASNQSTCSDRYWGSGGGATDMRLTTSLNSRLMVAGGGGGCYGANNNCTFSGASACSGGGAGGSLIGQAGQTANGYVPGAGATQINGGLAASQNGVTSIPGTFGIGGGQTTAGNAATGGGGGYYGGAGSGHIDAAGGGSSFMSGYAGSNAITSSSSTAATNDTLHYSGKYFISGSMYQGINSGNGRATISYAYPYKPVKINTNLNNVRYIKDCTTGNEIYTSNAYWIEVQAIKNGINVAKGKTVTGSNAIDTFHSSTYSVVTNGIVSDSRYEIACSTEVPTSKCVTVDLGQSYDLDEVAVWHVWGYTSLNNVTSVSSNNSTWTTLISNTIPETSTGKRVNAWE